MSFFKSVYDWCIENNRNDILSSWDYNANEISPKEIGHGSMQKIWWKCSFNPTHKWYSAVGSRSKTYFGCPHCKRHRKYSIGEKLFYFYLSKVFSDIESNKSYEWLNGLDLDMYIPSIKLGIEYDGYYHNHADSLEKDLRKSELMYQTNNKLIKIVEIDYLIDSSLYQNDYIFKLDFKWSKDNDFIKTNNKIKELLNYIENNFDLDDIVKSKIKNLKINILDDIDEIKELLDSIEINNSLLVKYPDIAKEWHPTKNGDLKPIHVRYGSDKKVWWQCEKHGHEWIASISHRTLSKTNCPYCENQKVLKGYNDLESQRPDIAKDWHPTKNGELKSSDVIYSSNKKAWWKCPNDERHEWYANISSRTLADSKCPICDNHKVLAGANDISTTNPELLEYWDYERNGDLKPTDFMIGSSQKVWWKCENGHNHSFFTSIYRRAKSSCTVCSNNQVAKGFNDLESQRPDIAKEWHPTKNGELKPSDVMVGTHKVVWWKCSKHDNHEWQTKVVNRTIKKEPKCPYCTNQKVLKGYNDLASQRPEVAKYWDYDKNGDLTPDEIYYNSYKKVYFKCDCGHKWYTNVSCKNICPKCNH